MKRRSSVLMPDLVARKLDDFSDEMREIGVSYVGYGVINKKGDHTGYFSCKEWGKYYVENGLFFDEPILESFEGAQIYSVDWHKINQNKVFALRQDKIKLISGVTFKNTVPDYDEFLNIGFCHFVNAAEFTVRNLSLIHAYFAAYQNTYRTFQQVCHGISFME